MAEDDRLRAAYGEIRARPRQDHPADEAWERLALGEMSGGERDALMDHVVRCAACSEVYRGLKELEREARTFDPGVPRAPSAPRLLSSAWYGGLAAAAVLILALLVPNWRGPTPPPDILRSPVAAAPVPVEPVGPVPARPGELRWQPVAGADGYRVELSNGGLLWTSGRVSDTRVVLPADVVLSPRVAYYWKVTALAGPDRRLLADAASPLVSFEIR